jgi:hypothetical protein
VTFALIRPRGMTRAELRRVIPYPALIGMQVKAALTGFLPTYDHNMEETGPAAALTVQQRLDTADKLIKKGLPDLKSDDEAERPTLDVESLTSLDADQIKRLTVAQIQAAIETSFTPVTEPTKPAAEPAILPTGAIDL